MTKLLRKTVGILLMVLIYQASISQCLVKRILKPVHEIVFDSSGKMIAFPGVYEKEKTSFRFTVSVPKTYLEGELQRMQKTLEETKKLLTDDPGNAEMKKAYPCILGTPYAFFIDKLAQVTQLIKQFPCSDDEVKAIKDGIDQLVAGANKISDLIPVKEFVTNILEQQYVVELKNGNLCKNTIQLKANLETCKSGCINFESADISLKELLCDACGVDHLTEVGFKLVRNDPYNKTTMDWFDKQFKILGIDTKEKEEQMQKDVQAVIDATTMATIDGKLSAIVNFSNWILRWFWYTQGKAVVLPFKTVDATDIKKQIKEKNELIAAARELIIFLDSAKANVPERIKTIPDFEKVQQEIAKKKKFIETTTTEIEGLQKDLGADIINNIRTYDVLYDGSFKLSNKGIFTRRSRSVNPMLQLDASNNFNRVYMNAFQREKVKDVPENERLHFLIHNLPAGVTAKVYDSPIAFDDQEEFTKLVSEQLGKINFGDVSKDMLRAAQSFIGSTQFPDPLKSSDKVKAGAAAGKDCKEGRLELERLLKEWVGGAVALRERKKLFEERLAGPVQYKTYMQQAIIEEAPFRDTFLVRTYKGTDSALVFKSSFGVGKLRYIQIAAGMAITRNPAKTTTIDTTGGGFQVNSEDNRAHAIVGFKIYPFKNYNRDNGLIPRYFFRRLSVFGGFDIIKPLNNFYVGGAYDVIPGLAFNLGVNYYLQTTYKIQNNAVTDTYRTYKKSGAYYAVTVNPVLFVQFVKLFFK